MLISAIRAHAGFMQSQRACWFGWRGQGRGVAQVADAQNRRARQRIAHEAEEQAVLGRLPERSGGTERRSSKGQQQGQQLGSTDCVLVAVC